MNEISNNEEMNGIAAAISQHRKTIKGRRLTKDIKKRISSVLKNTDFSQQKVAEFLGISALTVGSIKQEYGVVSKLEHMLQGKRDRKSKSEPFKRHVQSSNPEFLTRNGEYYVKVSSDVIKQILGSKLKGIF